MLVTITDLISKRVLFSLFCYAYCFCQLLNNYNLL